MSDVVEVVKVSRPECPGGFCEINVTDYDPAVHKIFGSKQVEQIENKKVKK